MTVSPSELSQRLEFALDAARQASELILRYYHAADLAVETKNDQSPVTAADRGAEELLRERIGAAYPHDGVLGEEFGEQPSQNGFRWILDPVDGTKSFVHGVPLFGTLIGLELEDRVVLGVCRFPALNEVVYAADGQGAWWQHAEAQPRQARVSSVNRLSDALLCVTTVTGWEQIGREDVFERLCGSVRLVRGWGDCYGHALVATGRAELIVEPQMNAWDAAALVPLLREAGGCYVDWEGRESIHSGNGLSVNAALKDLVLGLL